MSNRRRQFLSLLSNGGGGSGLWPTTAPLRRQISRLGSGKKSRREVARFTRLGGELLEPRNLLAGTASIAGTVWNDLDGDGSRGGAEPGLAGVTIYLDLNDNTAVNAGEPTQVTAGNGSYSFANLDAGNYVVREVVAANHRITSPQASGQRLFVLNNATTPHTINELNYQTGSLIRSFTAPAGSGSSFTASSLAFDGQTLYFRSGNTRTLYKLNPDTGTALGSAAIGGTDFDVDIAVRQGKVYLSNGTNSISIFDPATNTITGSLTLADGELSGPLGYTAATDELLTLDYYRVNFVSGTSGIQARSFEIGFGFDVEGVEAVGNEIFVTHRNGNNIQVFSHSGTLLRTLNTAFSPGDTGGYADVSGSNRLTLAAGQAAVNVNFGDAVGGIRGTRWQDANLNGVRDGAEVPLAGLTMYLDLNDNALLDTGEPTTLTQSDGSYAFNSLAAGSYAVRQVILSGRSQTYPLVTKTRLFTSSYVPTPSKIYELEPNTGAIINSFNAPFNGYADLAFDGTSLYTMSDVTETLYKLNPDTGAVIASAVLPSGFHVGLAAANGMLYSYPIGDYFTVIDPIAMEVVGTLPTSVNSETLWSVGQMTNPSRILGLTAGNQVVTYDATTGAESVGFSVAETFGSVHASASGPKLYVSDNDKHINVYSMASGILLQTLNFAPDVEGLVYRAGSDGAQRITLAPGQIATGVDFGTTEPTPINQPPTLAAIAEAVAIARDGSGTVNLSGISAGIFETQTLTITATSSNPAVVPNPTVNYTNPQATGSLTITPAANQIGTAVITVTLKDNGGTQSGGNDSFVRTFTVIVNGTPVLDAAKTPTLATVNEDPGAPSGAVGTLVSNLVDFSTPSGELDNVTDSDSGALLGLAVTAVDSSLACFYSLNDGTAWTVFGTVSTASARLISADNDNRVYCQPGLNVNGTFASALIFRAWDQTTGTEGETANTTTSGGGTAFSSVTDAISLTVTPVNDSPTATNLNSGETYTEDTSKNLVDIVVSDVDSATVTATLTLSNPSAGSLSIATSGAVTSTYVAATGVWTASGAITNVNTLLAGVVFNPAQDFNSTFTIATSIDDGVAAPITGSKAMTGTAVNDAPKGTNLNAAEIYTPNTPLDLVDIVASDVDSATLTVRLTLSNISAGSLTTGTSGAVTSTYNAPTGVWTASGAIANVNSLLAGVTFNPAQDFNSNFTIATSVSDGVAAAVTGSKSMIGPANNAPTATNLNASEAFTEDTALNLIDMVASDVDNTKATATLTLSNAAAGSLNTGTSGAVTSTFNAGTGIWTASGAIANVNTLLAGLTFTPAKDFNGNFTIATNISDDGGAFATGSKAMTGAAVNDAPVLDATKSPVLADVNEDAGAPSGAVGTLVSSLVDFAVPSGEVDNIADVDAASLLGVAVTGIGSGLTCHYSLDGGTIWSAMGTVSATSARLIAADSDNRIYCRPGLNANGTYAIAVTFRAWDQTSGTDGGSASTTTNGGTTAFSSNTDTIGLTVTAVNDAPTATNLNTAESYTEDTAKNFTDIVVSDLDSTPVTATLTLSNAAAGSLNTGTSGAVTSTFNAGTGIWTASGAIANVNTLLAGLIFTPTANFNENFTISTSVSDGEAAPITGSKTLTGTAVNDAPVLNTTKTPTLADISEGFFLPFGPGTLVSDLVDFATPSGGLDNITDVDSGALLGVAITAVDNNLICYYSLDGGPNSWQQFSWAGSPYVLAADSDNRIYCRPVSSNFNGTLAAALTFRAWDRYLAGNSDGFRVDIGPPFGSPTGGVTPFSTATDTIRLTITPVNDAPTATNLNAAESYTEDTPLDLIDIVASDVDSVLTATLVLSNASAGSLSTATSGAVTSTYDADTGVWMASGSVANVNTLLAGVVFNPTENFNGSFSINSSISDGEFTLSGVKVITGSAVNDAPQATNLNAAESYTEDTALELVDIVVSDVESTVVTATLTLSNPTAGSLSTATSGTTTSTFSSGAGVWTASGPIAEVNALLAGVRFNPTLHFNANFSILASVSDGDATVTGSRAVTGTPINDAPTATNLSAAESYTEDVSLNLRDIVISDVDSTVVTATLTVSNPDAGSLSTGVSGGVSSTYDPITGVWTASGATANVNAILAGIVFNPVAGFNSNFTIATNVSDGVAAAITGSKTITGSAVNDAPALNSGKSPALPSMLEDPGSPIGAVGALVSSLVDLTTPLGGLDNVAEADSGALLGIAIVSVDPSFTCYVSLNGGTSWATVGAVTTTAARLLAADADNRVYCLPVPNLNGNATAAFTFRAWDQTSGADGSTADTTTNGGTTAFSTTTDGVALLVQAVNDAPVKNGTTAILPSVVEDTLDPSAHPVANLFGSVFRDLDGTTIASGGVAINSNQATPDQGTWQFQIGNGTFHDFPDLASSAAVIVLATSDRLRFVPAPDFNGMPGGLTVRLWDGTGGFHSSDLVQDIGTSIGGSGAFSDDANEVTLSTTISPINDPPTLAPFSGNSTAADENPQTHGPALQKTELSWAQNFGAGASFETSQKLSFQVTNDNNGLFAVQPNMDSQGTLTYRPKPNMHGTATVTVVLKDDAGGNDTSATQQFDIVITKPHPLHNATEAGERSGLDVTGSTSNQPDGFIVAGDVLATINYINAKGSGRIAADLPAGPPYPDVNADNQVVAEDVLMIINYINGNPNQTEGESSGQEPSETSKVTSDLITLLSLDIAAPAVRRRRSQ